MDLLNFLSQETIHSANTVFCFSGPKYPALFFSIIKQKLKKILPLVSLDTLENEALLKAHLEMSFLGSQTLYWLSQDLIETYSTIVPYLVHYKGPNVVAFFTTKPLPASTDNIVIIEVPAEVNYQLFKELFTILYPTHAQKSSDLIKKVFKKYVKLTLDSSYMLMHYCILIGNKSDLFIQEWLTSIILPEKSLFTLSTYFFAKKSSLFFELWNSIASDYSEPFWTTYWSEQLFKAYAFIALSNNNNYIQAKRIAYRLPFSFMQKDWKSISLDELKNAHDHLYTLDWNLKNGLATNFEHFYLNFFLNKFH